MKKQLKNTQAKKNKSLPTGEEFVRLPSFDWDKAKVFYYVAKFGSFSEAANFLHTGQPSLSRKIKILESHLKCQLFTRVTRGVKITRKGEELFSIMERTFLDLKGFTYHTSVIGNKKKKRIIRISTTHAIAAYILNDIIFAYNKEHPEIIFELIGEDHIIDITLNDVDIAIRPYNPDKIDVQQDYLFTLQRKLYASIKYLERRGEPQTVEELIHHHIIAPARIETYPYSDLYWILKLGLPTGKMHEPVFKSTLLESLVEAAKNGMGIISGHEKMSLIRDSGLKNILPHIKDQPIDWYCIYPNFLQEDPQIKDFKDFLREKLA